MLPLCELLGLELPSMTMKIQFLVRALSGKDNNCALLFPEHSIRSLQVFLFALLSSPAWLMNQLLVWICIRASGWMRLIISAINIICFSLKATDGFPLSSLGACFDNIKCLDHQTSREVGDDGTKSIVLGDHCCLHMWSMSVLFQSWLELS